MRYLRTPFRVTRDQRGFTLVETLVAMLSAVVVVGALYAILDIAVGQTAKITDSVQANQTGRITIMKISEDLNSACVSSGFTPIQEGKEKKNEESKIVFINAYGTGPEPTAYEHQIVWKKSNGLLVDKISKGTVSGSSFTPASPREEKTVRIGENILQTETTPIFRYYKFNTKSSESSSTGLSTLKELEMELKSGEYVLKTPKEAAAVEISFKQTPLDKYTGENHAGETRAIDFKDQVTLSLSAPDAETPISEKPCE